MFHCAFGEGNNSVTDGFAVADKMRREYPEYYELVHSEEFKRHAKVAKGQLLICNNWRTMHGRAGLKGKARIILGGTVTRDAVYSAGRLAISRAYGVPDVHCGAPVSLLPYLAQRREPLANVVLRSSPRATEAEATTVFVQDDVQIEQQPLQKRQMM